VCQETQNMFHSKHSFPETEISECTRILPFYINFKVVLSSLLIAAFLLLTYSYRFFLPSPSYVLSLTVRISVDLGSGLHWG